MLTHLMISDVCNQAHGCVCDTRRLEVTVILVIKQMTFVCDVDVDASDKQRKLESSTVMLMHLMVGELCNQANGLLVIQGAFELQ